MSEAINTTTANKTESQKNAESDSQTLSPLSEMDDYDSGHLSNSRYFAYAEHPVKKQQT